MKQKLQAYYARLMELPQTEQAQLDAIVSQYIETYTKQITISANRHWQRYQQHKKPSSTELETLKYYLTLSQQPPSSPDHQTWTSTLKSTNLYSLFKQIDDKLAYNAAMLEQFIFVSIQPRKEDNHYEGLLGALAVYREQGREYGKLVSQLLTKLGTKEKGVVEMHKQYRDIQEKYNRILDSHMKVDIQQEYSNQLIVKDSIEYTIAQLTTHRYLRNIQASLISQTGITSLEEYSSLAQALASHRFYLRSLTLRLMDMQFSQQKCDALKRELKKMKAMEKLVIWNYYGECKLGMFTDFNWAPFRKGVNVRAGVWK